jgi:hypothetical protein
MHPTVHVGRCQTANTLIILLLWHVGFINDVLINRTLFSWCKWFTKYLIAWNCHNLIMLWCHMFLVLTELASVRCFLKSGIIFSLDEGLCSDLGLRIRKFRMGIWSVCTSSIG